METEYEHLRRLARAAQDRGSRDLYNSLAMDHIFRINNARCAEDEIDLHGLFVREAKNVLRERIEVEVSMGSIGIHV